MADRASDGSRDGADGPAFETGRYLYCVVDAGDAGDDLDATLPVEGVDGGDPYLVTADGLGAVAQACESAYASTDPDTVKRWLLRHQTVIDAAAKRFGTPLPFRFDTVLKGDDGAVREWLDGEADELDAALADLAGQREYRIEVSRDRTALEERVAAEDDRLADLRARREDASEGTAFLVGKQYDRRVDELLERHVAEETDALVERLREVASEVERVDRTSSPLDDRPADGDRHRSTLAVLAPEDREAALGDRLDEVAARPGVEVRFTGPWPPYSFAPSFGGES